MLGNWDRDPDRYGRACRMWFRVFCARSTAKRSSAETIDSWMNARRKMPALWWAREHRMIPAGRRGAAGAAGGVGSPARRRASDGMRDRLVPRGAAAGRVCAAHQSAAVEECADLPHRMRPRGAHDSGARQTFAQQPCTQRWPRSPAAAERSGPKWRRDSCRISLTITATCGGWKL